MNNARYRYLMTTEDAQLTEEEKQEGWHFCWEFDGLLTQGEKGPRECFCGVFKDGQWVSGTPTGPTLPGDAFASQMPPSDELVTERAKQTWSNFVRIYPMLSRMRSWLRNIAASTRCRPDDVQSPATQTSEQHDS